MSVSLDFRADTVALEVTDNGSGTSYTGSTTGHGHGLAGMRERAALYGGTLLAGPGPQGGFAVTAVLPAPRTAVREALSTPGTRA